MYSWMSVAVLLFQDGGLRETSVNDATGITAEQNRKEQAGGSASVPLLNI